MTRGAKTCDSLKCSEPFPHRGKSGEMFPLVGEQLGVQWDTFTDLNLFAVHAFDYHLLRGSKTLIQLGAVHKLRDQQTPLCMH